MLRKLRLGAGNEGMMKVADDVRAEIVAGLRDVVQRSIQDFLASTDGPGPDGIIDPLALTAAMVGYDIVAPSLVGPCLDWLWQHGLANLGWPVSEVDEVP